MNCPKCNNTLLPNARFCPVCGYSIAAVAPFTPTPEPPLPQAQRQPDYAQPSAPGPTFQGPPQQWSDRSPQQPQFTPQQQPSAWSERPPQQFQPQAQFPPQQQPGTFGQQQQALQATDISAPVAPPTRAPRKNRLGGCLLRVAIVLAVLVLLLVGSWNFAVRPWLHSMAADQMGKVLNGSLEQINPLATLLIPAGIPLPVPESLIAQALVAPTSSWFTIQDMQLSVTSANIRFAFQVQVGSFTFTCGVTTIPEAVNGQLDVKSISVDGPIGIVMTADEMKAQINTYLSQVHDRINRPFKSFTLEDGFIVITFG